MELPFMAKYRSIPMGPLFIIKRVAPLVGFVLPLPKNSFISTQKQPVVGRLFPSISFRKPKTHVKELSIPTLY